MTRHGKVWYQQSSARSPGGVAHVTAYYRDRGGAGSGSCNLPTKLSLTLQSLGLGQPDSQHGHHHYHPWKCDTL